MNRPSKTRAVASPAEQDHYRPSFTAALLALAAAIFLIWHGMARAEDFAPPQDNAGQPAASDSMPAAPGCTDNMDFSPEENLPSPFDADSVAFRHSPASRPMARPAATDDSCQTPDQRPEQV